jgi:hypothetical protein
MAKQLFQKGNSYGQGRPKGSPNAINKTEAINLVNMLLEDLTTNYETLSVWQKLKLFGYMKDILKEAIVETKEVTEPKVFDIVIHHTEQNEQKAI